MREVSHPKPARFGPRPSPRLHSQTRLDAGCDGRACARNSEWIPGTWFIRSPVPHARAVRAVEDAEHVPPLALEPLGRPPQVLAGVLRAQRLNLVLVLEHLQVLVVPGR